MAEQTRVTVPANEGRSFRVTAGEIVTIVDVEGYQIGDLVFFSADDPHERLSTSCTRARCGRLSIGEGDQLFSTRGNPLVTIIEDRVSAHDIVSHPCDKGRYELDFHVVGHPSCTENLVRALEEAIGLESWWLPDPFNVFMNTVFLEDGRYFTEAAISKPGDRIVMRAKMDLIGAISACPQDLYPANGYQITDLEVIVGDTNEYTAESE